VVLKVPRKFEYFLQLTVEEGCIVRARRKGQETYSKTAPPMAAHEAIGIAVDFCMANDVSLQRVVDVVAAC
jgi:hypothetical protein